MSDAPTVYLLYGDDEVSLSEFVRDRLISKLGDPALAELNQTRFEGRSVTLADLRAAGTTLPFLASRRLLIVTGYLSGLAKRPGGKREAEALVEFFAELPPSTALVLIEVLEPLNGRGRETLRNSPVLHWARAAGTAAFVRAFEMPKGDGLPGWVMRRARKHGGQFAPQAAEALAAAVGDLPRLLDSEILKLLTYANFERPVEPEDVERLTPYAGQPNIFAMVDALGQGDGSTAFKELHRLLEGKDAVEGYFAVFPMIVRQFRLLLQARELMDQNGAGEAARALRVPPFVADKILRQARNFTLPALEAIYRKLLEVDEKYKTGQVEGPAALDLLVGELSEAHSRRAGVVLNARGEVRGAE